jgi:sulfatase modifying factor 1
VNELTGRLIHAGTLGLAVVAVGCGGLATGAGADGGPDVTSDVGSSDVRDDPAADGAPPSDVRTPYDAGPDAGPERSCSPGGPGMTNCGTAKESCCTSLEVTGGTFYRTYRNDGGGPAHEADPATVSSFRLDKYDVTVGRIRQFVKAWKAGYTPPAGSGKHNHLNGGRGLVNSASISSGTIRYETGWLTAYDTNIAPTDSNLGYNPYCGPDDPMYCDGAETWTGSPAKHETLPINEENWWEAYAFCIWDGGFLPSEAEWEYAAAGGRAEREYPWGSTPPGTRSKYAIYDCYYPSGLESCAAYGVANVAPVGTATLGAGAWGQLDLAGELDEWNLDWHAPYVTPCVNCAYLDSPGPKIAGRVLRGGDFETDIPLIAAYRYDAVPASRALAFGFRCARSP